METPTKQPETNPECTDAAKVQPTPKENLLHEIGQIIGGVRAKKEKLEKALAKEARAAEEKHRQEKETMAAFLKQGKTLAVNLFGDKKETTNLPFDKQTVVNTPEEYVEAMTCLFEVLERWRDKEWLKINHEYHQIDFRELSRSELERRVLDGRATVERNPVASVYTPCLPTGELKEKYERDYIELDERTALVSRTYQHHIRGFSQAAIQLTIDKKRYDQYLNLMGIITNLLAIENLQFDGMEHIVAGMVRLIEEFNKEVVEKELNPEKLGAIQKILDAIRKRVQGLTLTK